MSSAVQEKEPANKHSESVGCKLGVANAVQNCFNNPEMSDIVLKLGSKPYYCHKFVLGLMSDVFRTMCSQRWEHGTINELVLQENEECIPVFPVFLQHLYSGVSNVNIDTALPLLMLADKYNVQSLKHGCENYMKKKVNDGSIIGALRWLSYAQMSGNVSLQNACIDVVVTKMDDVVHSMEFLHLDIEFLELLFQRDDLVVLWEYTLFDALNRWISTQQSITDGDISKLMSYVRFPMMLPMQLLSIEKSSFYKAHSKILEPLFASAHRFRSIASEIGDESFIGIHFRPRNYTHSHWCHMICGDVDTDGFVQKSIGVRCLNHPVIVGSSPEQCWQLKLQPSNGDRNALGNAAGKARKSSSGMIMAPFAFCSATDQVYNLDLSVIPMKPIAQGIAVDISLFLVKRDKLVKHLQDTTLFHQNDSQKIMKRGENASSLNDMTGNWHGTPPGNSGNQRVFNPAPMHFSFMFHHSSLIRNNEAVIKHCFSLNDLEHPAEVPCFKFAGPSRTTNAVRLAIVFKPRFDFSTKSESLGTSLVLSTNSDNEDNSEENVVENGDITNNPFMLMHMG